MRKHFLSGITGIAQPYRFRDDGPGPGTGGDPAPGGGGGGTGTPPANQPTSPPAPPTEPAKLPHIDGQWDAERGARAIAAAREAEAKAKAEAKAADDARAKILAALGLTADGQQDPATLAAQAAKERDDAKAAARAAATDLAVFRAAAKPVKVGDTEVAINAAALLDSAEFKAQVAALDPAANDFADQVTGLMVAAVKAKPWLASAPAASGAPARSGGDFSGGTGAGQPVTEAQLAKMSPDEIAEAYAAGKLKHLM